MVCLSNWAKFTSEECSRFVTALSVLVPFVIAVGGAIILGIRHVCSSIRQDNIFDLCFVDHEPPSEREIDRGNLHEIPLGPSARWIKIITHVGLDLSHFDVRFIPDSELSKRPTDPPTNMKQIIQITQVFPTDAVRIQANDGTMMDDQYGGIDIVLNRSVPWGAGKAIFLKIDILAHQVWSGKISFQSFDKENNPRYARADVRVVSDGVEAKTL